MQIEHADNLQGVMAFLDKDSSYNGSFEEEWQRSLSVDDYQKHCKVRLSELYG